MCFAIPLKVVSKNKDKWVMEDGRTIKSLVKNIGIGDYLVCQQDMGVDKLNKTDALKMRSAIKGVSDEI
jgi:hydrogenase maturation factor